MFIKTYKTTLKNLIRSPIFWMSFALVIINVIWWANQNAFGNVDEFGNMIWDTDPRYQLSYDKYMLLIPNSLAHWIMFYAMPAFAVISTMLVISGDYRNGFYEIEKSSGVRPSGYFIGRLSALTTVNLIAAVISSLLAVNLYYFTRGGVKGMELSTYLSDSTMRILRIVVCCELPAILLCIGLTYMIGAILKNGFAGAVFGISYVIAIYAVNANFQYRMSNTFSKYLNMGKFNAYLYFTFYDTEFANAKGVNFNGYMPSPFSEIMTWLAIMVGLVFICFIVSYICTRRRKI